MSVDVTSAFEAMAAVASGKVAGAQANVDAAVAMSEQQQADAKAELSAAKAEQRCVSALREVLDTEGDFVGDLRKPPLHTHTHKHTRTDTVSASLFVN